jgi:hypothetical protein
MTGAELFQRKKSKKTPKHMKKCSTSLTINKMQIKTTLRFHLTPVRMVTIIHCWWECKLVQPLWKTWQFLKKLKIELPYDPAIPLLEIYLKECKSDYNKVICTSMFIAALFIIAKLCEQPTCPTIEEWIKKCRIYIHWNFIQPQRRMKFCHCR